MKSVMLNASSAFTAEIPHAVTMPTTKPKRFSCTYEGCGKAFTRSDHLQRHHLNHDDSGQSYDCPRCALHFKRPDLLERHVQRHKEKDDEAGGEGLGIVQTRKRMWRDVGGRIVSQRPGQSNNEENRARKRQPDNSSADAQDLAQFDLEHMDMTLPGFEVPILTPPSTLHGSETLEQEPLFSPPAAMDNTSSCGGSDMFDFLANSAWGQVQPGIFDATTDMPIDDIFQPDTASSFNMPFTTMNRYVTQKSFHILSLTIQQYVEISFQDTIFQNLMELDRLLY